MFMMVFQFAKLNKEDRIGKLHRIATKETNKDGTEPRHPSQSTSCSLLISQPVCGSKFNM